MSSEHLTVMPCLMLTGDCPLAISLATSGPSTAHIYRGAGVSRLSSQRGGVWCLSEAEPGPWRGMLCSCSAVLLTLLPRGQSQGAWAIRGMECHFCHLLSSLCRQQNLGSLEGTTTLGGEDPRGEGPGCLGLVPLSWVST